MNLLLPSPDGKAQAGNAEKSKEFHQVPESVTCSEQSPFIVRSYPQQLDGDITRYDIGSGFAKP